MILHASDLSMMASGKIARSLPRRIMQCIILLSLISDGFLIHEEICMLTNGEVRIAKSLKQIIRKYFSEITMDVDPKFQMMVWEYLNDTIKSEIFFRFSTKAIAGACIHLSASLLHISLPMCSNRSWLLFFEQQEKYFEVIGRHLMAFRSDKTSQKELEELKETVAHASIALALLELEKTLKDELTFVVDQMHTPHSNSSAENKPPSPDGKENKLEMKKSGIESKANRDTNQRKRKRISPSTDGMNKPHRKQRSKIGSSSGILSSHTPSPSKRPPEVSRIPTSQDQGLRVKVMKNDEIQMLKLEDKEEES